MLIDPDLDGRRRRAQARAGAARREQCSAEQAGAGQRGERPDDQGERRTRGSRGAREAQRGKGGEPEREHADA